MNDTLPDDEAIASGGTLKSWHLLVIVVAAVAVAVGIYYGFFVERAPETGPTGGVAVVPQGSRTVTLYFADEEDPVLVSEMRQVAIGKGFVEQIQQVMRALVSGPEQGGANTIPQGSRLLAVFYDPDAFTVYLDFSSEFIAGHPGGSAAEYSTVLAILRTISENFPEIQAVQILVEGFQVGTIAGHVDAYSPFQVQNWR